MILDAYSPIDAKVTSAIDAALAPYREALGIKAVNVAPDEDHDGDAVIRVRLEHRLAEPQTAFNMIHQADSKIRQSVWEQGERRFVHVRHAFADDTTLDTLQ